MGKKKKPKGQLHSGRINRLIYVGTRSDGTRRYESFTADTAAQADADAKAFRLKVRELRRQGVAVEDIPRDDVPVKPSGRTVGDALALYIDSCDAAGLSPSTLLGYRRIAARASQAILGASVDTLTIDGIQEYINAQARRGLSSKTVRNEISLIISALRTARPDLNSQQLRLPRAKSVEMQIPTTADVSRMLTATQGTPLYVPILLAALLGLRRSEICALSWSDINFKRRTIHIHAAEVKNDAGGFTIKGTKTRAGDRIIAIPSHVAAQLRKARTLSPRVTDLTPDAITRRYERLLDRLTNAHHPRIPGRFHDLRHYHASVMIAVGAPDKYISADMGHSSMDMVRRVYGHVMADRQHEINDQMEAQAAALFGVMQNEMQNAPKKSRNI